MEQKSQIVILMYQFKHWTELIVKSLFFPQKSLQWQYKTKTVYFTIVLHTRILLPNNDRPPSHYNILHMMYITVHSTSG